MPKNAYVSTNLQSSGQPQNDVKTLFFSHSPSPFPCDFANTTVVSFLSLRSSRFNFHCNMQRVPAPTQKSARKWQLRPFATSCTKDYEGHSLLQTSIAEPPNRPTAGCVSQVPLDRRPAAFRLWGRAIRPVMLI